MDLNCNENCYVVNIYIYYKNKTELILLLLKRTKENYVKFKIRFSKNLQKEKVCNPTCTLIPVINYSKIVIITKLITKI